MSSLEAHLGVHFGDRVRNELNYVTLRFVISGKVARILGEFGSDLTLSPN